MTALDIIIITIKSRGKVLTASVLYWICGYLQRAPWSALWHPLQSLVEMLCYSVKQIQAKRFYSLFIPLHSSESSHTVFRIRTDYYAEIKP